MVPPSHPFHQEASQEPGRGVVGFQERTPLPALLPVCGASVRPCRIHSPGSGAGCSGEPSWNVSHSCSVPLGKLKSCASSSCPRRGSRRSGELVAWQHREKRQGHSLGSPVPVAAQGVIREAVRKQELTFIERLFWTRCHFTGTTPFHRHNGSIRQRLVLILTVLMRKLRHVEGIRGVFKAT